MEKEDFNKIMDEIFNKLPPKYPKSVLFWRLGIDGSYRKYSSGKYHMRPKKVKVFLNLVSDVEEDFDFYKKFNAYKSEVSFIDIERVSKRFGLEIKADTDNLFVKLVDPDFPQNFLILNWLFSKRPKEDLYKVCYNIKQKGSRFKEKSSKDKFYELVEGLLNSHLGRKRILE